MNDQLRIGKGKPGPGRPKGKRNARTEVKELLGLDSPDRLRTLDWFIRSVGVERLIKQMNKLTGFKYVQAWQLCAEYVLPKLSRAEVKHDHSTDQTLQSMFAAATIEQKLKLLELIRSISKPAEEGFPLIDKEGIDDRTETGEGVEVN
jgi:hypothetical protein